MTFPNSRGSVGVIALLAAVVLLAASLWIAFGARDAEVDARLAAVDDGRGTGSAEPDRLALLDEAQALYSKRSIWTDGLAYPSDLRLVRQRPIGEPPGVEALTGALDGADLLLTWRPSGGTRQGYLLQRIAEDGSVMEEQSLPASARSFRDGPVDALLGARTYRVTALNSRGQHSGAAQQRIPYRVDFAVEFLGFGSGGEGRFRILRHGPDEAAAEFAATPAAEIGGDAPGMNWRTGWRYLGPKSKRTQIECEREVPSFMPDGRLERDPMTGAVIYQARTVSATKFEHGALVRRPGPNAGELGAEDVWLPPARE